MSRRNPDPGNGSVASGGDCSDSTLPRLTAEHVARWADRIADGRDEFPAQVVGADRAALEYAVRLRLRRRLVRLVARAIAGRLHASGVEAI
ncbi:hypothetical protein [Urbifossiella limnaea]|uniref:Uncharacterized protein n=1 Tax=Urbifossiella limnaea TaxID=2528023 RepID=A0A517XWC6_9BACT|nr:hypothetical protein [Urbifossiella limnaea]QDU21815.1 hypothetical protein ETAA1_37880 [Urbifossiella limnaea]